MGTFPTNITRKVIIMHHIEIQMGIQTPTIQMEIDCMQNIFHQSKLNTTYFDRHNSDIEILSNEHSDDFYSEGNSNAKYLNGIIRNIKDLDEDRSYAVNSNGSRSVDGRLYDEEQYDKGNGEDS